MKFDEFFNAPKSLAIVLTIKEYREIKTLLRHYYTEKEIKRIDDYCEFKWESTKFMLCNLHEKQSINTPLMLENAVTFIDRMGLKDIEFKPAQMQIIKRKDFSDMSNQALAYLLRGYMRCNGCDGCPCKHIICLLGPNSYYDADKEFLLEIAKRLED